MNKNKPPFLVAEDVEEFKIEDIFSLVINVPYLTLAKLKETLMEV